MKKTKASPKLTVTEERERIEKTGLVHMEFVQVDQNTIRFIPKNMENAMRGMNKSEDMVIFPSLGIAVPAMYLRKFAPLMGDAPVVMVVDRKVMTVTMTYKVSEDSRSRTMIKGTDAQEWESTNEWERPTEFTARVTSDPIPDPALIDKWLEKAVSKDPQRKNMGVVYGNVASDAYRIHFDPRITQTTPPPYDAATILHESSRVDNAALIDSAALVAALKLTSKANKKSVTLNVNGHFEVSALAKDDESTVSQTVTELYQHSGENVNLKISPAYLLDALSGMDGEVIIGISSPRENLGHTVYISDGIRSAVIMSQKS